MAAGKGNELPATLIVAWLVPRHGDFGRLQGGRLIAVRHLLGQPGSVKPPRTRFMQREIRVISRLHFCYEFLDLRAARLSGGATAPTDVGRVATSIDYANLNPLCENNGHDIQMFSANPPHGRDGGHVGASYCWCKAAVNFGGVYLVG